MAPYERFSVKPFKSTNFTESLFQNNKHGYESLFDIVGQNNTYLTVRNSTFKRNFTFRKGAIMFTQFQRGFIFLHNCEFTQNTAVYGAVLTAEFEARIYTYDCNFYENFGFFAAVSWTGMDGGMYHQGGSMYNNYALASLISEFHDATWSSFFIGVHIYSNKQLTVQELWNEYWWCDILCFIDPEYLEYYGSTIDYHLALNRIQSSLFKTDVVYIELKHVIIEDAIGILTSLFCDFDLFNVTIWNSVI